MQRECKRWDAFKILTGEATRKRFLGKPRRIWEVNIRMDPKDMGVNTRNVIDSAQDVDYWRSLVNATLDLRASQVIQLIQWNSLQ